MIDSNRLWHRLALIRPRHWMGETDLTRLVLMSRMSGTIAR